MAGIDEVLSIDLIRSHTKTDDNPRVTNEMIVLYRRAAIETAELYTGISLSSVKEITEHVRIRRGRVLLSHIVADRWVYFFGGHLASTLKVPAVPGRSYVDFPGGSDRQIYMIGDCHRCGVEEPLMAMYQVGKKCADQIPAGIIVGCLKYIAWTMENAGDVIMTVRNRFSSGENMVSGTNDAAQASGALDEWTRYRSVVQ